MSSWSKPMGSHFGVGAPPILEPILVGIGMFAGGYEILTHGHMSSCTACFLGTKTPTFHVNTITEGGRVLVPFFLTPSWHPESRVAAKRAC